MTTTATFRRHIDAPPECVYRLLLDRDAVRRWKVPDGMRSHVHAFDACEGGAFRVSLTYDAADAAKAVGKTQARTDTYHGRFVSLVPYSKVVEATEFETADAAFAGEMTITWTLAPAAGGTDLTAVHAGVPDGISAADNALGWNMALDKLAALAEAAS